MAAGLRLSVWGWGKGERGADLIGHQCCMLLQCRSRWLDPTQSCQCHSQCHSACPGVTAALHADPSPPLTWLSPMHTPAPAIMHTWLRVYHIQGLRGGGGRWGRTTTLHWSVMMACTATPGVKLQTLHLQGRKKYNDCSTLVRQTVLQNLILHECKADSHPSLKQQSLQ